MAGRSRPCSLATWSTCVSSTGLFSSARSAFLAAKASLAFVNHLDQQWVHACLAIAGGVVVAAACLVGRWLFNQHQDKQQLHQQHTVSEEFVLASPRRRPGGFRWFSQIAGSVSPRPPVGGLESTVSYPAAVSLQNASKYVNLQGSLLGHGHQLHRRAECESRRQQLDMAGLRCAFRGRLRQPACSPGQGCHCAVLSGAAMRLVTFF